MKPIGSDEAGWLRFPGSSNLLLFAEPWPSELRDLILRGGAIAMVIAALALFPRYEAEFGSTTNRAIAP